MDNISKIEWIPVVVRPTTDEEKEIYGVECEVFLDFRLPEYDEQEVLVTLKDGTVTTEHYAEDWHELEYIDWDNIRAWAELPKGYGE